MDKCIFCMIVNGEIPSKVVFESENVVAFEDINPQAPVHVVVIPKKHMKNIIEFSTEEANLTKEMMEACVKVAEIKNIKDDGFRVINNCGENAGQTVMHFHMHVLGGGKFNERII